MESRNMVILRARSDLARGIGAG